jgi:hypothetical protein
MTADCISADYLLPLLAGKDLKDRVRAALLPQ